ncbi:hypothetical protein [Halobacillus karajensis]|uniref:hypothetical protein n=1 Tax=Halobacillus karajensis TaxID=195088 RepID=UPI001114FAB6|nr:hypothetical protein [Halobacillus karajensis]
MISFTPTFFSSISLLVIIPVTDAYCGIGIFANEKARKVVHVEANKYAVRDAIPNTKRNGVKNLAKIVD